MYYLFQFHKGTIKTVLPGGCHPGALPFQFHKGTIKTRLHICARLVSPYFNSIKVQLKLSKQKSNKTKH